MPLADQALMSSPQLSPWGSALAGAMAAVFANASIYPLDTVKTRIQAADGHSADQKQQEQELATVEPAPAPEDRKPKAAARRRGGLTHGLATILKEEGVGGFYKGFLANMINTFSMQYAYFFFYSLVRSLYVARKKRRQAGRGGSVGLSTAAELLLGALAGALAQIFTIPVAVIATRQQLSKPEDGGEQSLLGVAREILAEDGPAGLWRGLRPGLVLTVNPALTYGLSSRLKEVIIARQGSVKLSPVQSFALGAFSKSIATVVTYPYIMAKVRLQARRYPSVPAVASSDTRAPGSTLAPKPGEELSQAPVSYAAAAARASSPAASAPTAVSPSEGQLTDSRADSAVDILRRVYAVKGFTGLYQGMGAQIFKAVLTQGILFTVKDQFEAYAYVVMLLLARSAASVPHEQAHATLAAVKREVGGTAKAVGEQLPTARQGLRLAERAAGTVGKDVVEKLAVDAVVGAIQR